MIKTSPLALGIILFCASLVVAGIGVGVLSGLLGIGGGTVMVPLLRLLFGLPALSATATSLFVIIPTSISGVATHLRQKTCIPALGVAMGVGGAITSVGGVFLSEASPSWLVMCVAGAVIGYSAFSMLRKNSGKQKADDLGTAEAFDSRQLKAPSKTEHPGFTIKKRQIATQSESPRQLVAGLGIGALAGVISGYVGVGGGFIMVPLMCAWLNVPIKLASGTSLIAILILAIPGTIAQFTLGNVNVLTGILLAAGSIPGAIIGAKLIKRVPENILRRVFACLLLLAGAILIINEFCASV